jgi:hypothetical protein
MCYIETVKSSKSEKTTCRAITSLRSSSSQFPHIPTVKSSGAIIKIMMNNTRCRWLTPVFLATWEAEIRRITDHRSRPAWTNNSRDPIPKIIIVN